MIAIGRASPPRRIGANAHALARYAAICQEAGIVPIVEPEVLMDGDAPLERCAEVTDETLYAVFAALRPERVPAPGIAAQAQHGGRRLPIAVQAAVEEVASATVRCSAARARSVPGIVFLSGGQSDEEATAHLNAMNALGGRAVEVLLLLRPRAPGPLAEVGPGGGTRPRPGRPRSSTARAATARPGTARLHRGAGGGARGHP